MIEELIDPRRFEPSFTLNERAMLEGWLEFHRVTLLMKCEGLDDKARKSQPISSSKLSLQGLVRHMAEVERGWFQRVLEQEPELPYIYSTKNLDDGEFVSLDTAVWDDDLATWQNQCATSRRVASNKSLDDFGLRRGEPCSLRWIFTHMIEEYARHNGHADIIRELIDGSVGW